MILVSAVMLASSVFLSRPLRHWLTVESSTGQRPEPHRLRTWRTLDDLPRPMAQFDSVFWEPRDTESLRTRIVESGLVRGRSVLEIGTGTGLIALYCLGAGARSVVATDVNPAAIANARFNARQFGIEQGLDTRLVPLARPTAFAVIGRDERFDLIISNPPWENDRPRTIAEYALYDPGFRLLHSLLTQAHQHLNPEGRMWLAYGSRDAIREIQVSAPRLGWNVRWLDPRRFEELPPVFLPGLLLELVPAEQVPAERVPFTGRTRGEPD